MSIDGYAKQITLQVDVFESINGNFYRELIPLDLTRERFSTFIFTDKSVYSLGETINLSIFSFDSETLPYNPKSAVVSILSSGLKTEKSFVNVTFVKGKYKGSYELKEISFLGTSNILFEAEGKVRFVKNIKNHSSVEKL
jgi:hypothetical protein